MCIIPQWIFPFGVPNYLRIGANKYDITPSLQPLSGGGIYQFVIVKTAYCSQSFSVPSEYGAANAIGAAVIFLYIVAKLGIKTPTGSLFYFSVQSVGNDIGNALCKLPDLFNIASLKHYANERLGT